MAEDRNPDVMEMVEETLRDDPDYSTKDLKLKAEEIDGDIEDLSIRQFNARYPLQVKRRLAAEEGASGDGGRGESARGTEAEGDAGGGGTAGAGDGASAEDARERVFEMIEEALRDDPDVTNDVLQERAAEIDPAIADLSSRSFHARYPLQVKRRMAAEREEEESEEEPAVETGGRADLRAAVRDVLLDFAKDVAGAEDRGEVIEVLTSVDGYVDRVMENA